MSSSLSPERSEGGHAGGLSSDGETGISSLNLGILKTLNDKKTTREGNTPKKRGPKPNSKPALTRRQELNRQAQRTHRERKELYIKALEDEVLRLKEIYSYASNDKEKLAEENRHLRAALAQHGIRFSSPDQPEETHGFISTASMSGSTAPGSSSAFTPPLTQSTAASVTSSGQGRLSPMVQQPMGGNQLRDMTQHASHQSGLDVEQAGIDFVLTYDNSSSKAYLPSPHNLERPCMMHLPWLLNRAVESGVDSCGHALMASCPPQPFTGQPLGADVPFGTSHICGDLESGQMTWELSKADLSTLLDLSKKLDLDGEITPVMAWGIILTHSRFQELQASDLHKIDEELVRKVRCYGFGAVLEEFELRDAIENVLTCGPQDVVMG